MSDKTLRMLVALTCFAGLAHLASIHVWPAPAVAAPGDGLAPRCEKLTAAAGLPSEKRLESLLAELLLEGRTRFISGVGNPTVICAW